MSASAIDLDRLLKLRVAIGRIGEGDRAAWWNTADGIISQLLAATDQRLAAETTPFADVYDFVARLRSWFLQANSSDLLLVALLPEMARIFARDSSQDPGITRIREMAQDYIATTTEAGSEGRASDA